MDAFPQLVDSLAPYFSAIAQISGSLVGLVFVALTFNIKALGLRGDPALRALAQQTLSDFLIVLMLSLSLLIPHMPTMQIGVVLAVLGTAGILRGARSLLTVHRSGGEKAPRQLLLQRFGLSLLGCAFILYPAILLLAHSPNTSSIGSLLEGAPLVLIISGCRTAWLLVLHAAD